MPAPKRKPATRQIHLPEVTVEAARDLIELNSQGLDSVGDQLLWLSKLDTAACQGTCKQNDKSNPNCFCALVPPEGSFKKKGLWKKEPDALGNLGADPHDNAREVGAPQFSASHTPCCSAKQLVVARQSVQAPQGTCPPQGHLRTQRAQHTATAYQTLRAFQACPVTQLRTPASAQLSGVSE